MPSWDRICGNNAKFSKPSLALLSIHSSTIIASMVGNTRRIHEKEQHYYLHLVNDRELDAFSCLIHKISFFADSACWNSSS